jgi:hypothetical protein
MVAAASFTLTWIDVLVIVCIAIIVALAARRL